MRAAVADVLAHLDGEEDAGAPRREGMLDRHGRLEAEEQRRVVAQAIAEVVRPAARALLGAPRSPGHMLSATLAYPQGQGLTPATRIVRAGDAGPLRR